METIDLNAIYTRREETALLRDRIQQAEKREAELCARVSQLEATVKADAELQASRAPFSMQAFDRIASALETIARKMKDPNACEHDWAYFQQQHQTRCRKCGIKDPLS